MTELSFDVLVVGGGPAGIAAAGSAAAAGARVGLVDDNPAFGGQIWRRGAASSVPKAARPWIEALELHNVQPLCQATVIDAPAPGRLLAVSNGAPLSLRYGRLILATGALEVFCPFPGWTLPGVMGLGGLQAMVKQGLDVRRRRVLVAGSGPLLLAVADLLKRQGAQVTAIIEQAERRRMLCFARRLWNRPGKLRQAASYGSSLIGVPKYFDAWPIRVDPGEEESAPLLVDVRTAGEGRKTFECDLLACGFGLRPNVSLARYLGCRITDGKVSVDPVGRTSLDEIFCAGEPTGIGGVDAALIEGRIAGLVAAGGKPRSQDLKRRRAERRFADSLASTFALNESLHGSVDASTIVCRCEDVTWGAIAPFDDLRDCKLKTRCGMGPCQGRVCGGALQILKGWTPEKVRPPFFPVPLDCLTLDTRPLEED